MQGMYVQSLLWELRSYEPHSAAKFKKKLDDKVNFLVVFFLRPNSWLFVVLLYFIHFLFHSFLLISSLFVPDSFWGFILLFSYLSGMDAHLTISICK